MGQNDKTGERAQKITAKKDMDTHVPKSISKQGLISLSPVSYTPWLSIPVSTVSGKTRRTKVVNTVTHPIFFECAKVVQDDPFWLQVFTKASQGRMPGKKFVFNAKNGELSYRKSTNRIETVTVPANPYEAYSICKDFFRRHGGLSSSKDDQEALMNANVQQCQATQVVRWSKVKKKMKEVMIANFVSDIVTTYKLTREQGRQLSQTITEGIILGCFHKDNIHLNNNRICQIEGLNWDKDAKCFYYDINTINIKITKSVRDPSKDSVITFARQWDKYLTYYDKKFLKGNKRGRGRGKQRLDDEDEFNEDDELDIDDAAFIEDETNDDVFTLVPTSKRDVKKAGIIDVTQHPELSSDRSNPGRK